MKVKDLTKEQRLNFGIIQPKFDELLKIKLSHLSISSINLYKRALSYISVFNNIHNKNIKDITIYLVTECLTFNNLSNIIGNEETPNTSKNIRISSFKNLVEIYKNEINNEISTVAYDSIIKMLGMNGGIIRKNIFKERSIIENNTNITYSWEDLVKLNDEYLKTFYEIKINYLKFNEVPDYIFLRDCLVSNLYLNNIDTYQDYKFNVILRNEYKSCYLYIGDNPPTNNLKNYFWLNVNNNISKIIINKNKTTGGYKRNKGTDIGHTHIVNQKKQKIFPLNNKITEIILFIQHIFHERKDKPFIKSNNRINNYTSGSWSKMLGRVLKKIEFKITSSNLRKLYFYNIKKNNYSTNIKHHILEMSDYSLNYNFEEN